MFRPGLAAAAVILLLVALTAACGSDDEAAAPTSPATSPPSSGPPATAAAPATPPPTTATGDSTEPPATTSPAPRTTAAAAATEPPTTDPPPPPTVAPPPESTTTSCSSVVHIGDSTSVGLISSSYLADPATRIDAQYRRVGVTEPILEISGARSTVETLNGQINARDLAAGLKADGFEGCWVLALGTTDTANVAVAPGGPDRAARIDRMMEAIGDDPVLWVNVKTLVGPGDAWSGENMQRWNEALVAATARYPNLRIFDWAAVVQDSWFENDEIHYTSEGYAQRGRLIAEALAVQYPA